MSARAIRTRDAEPVPVLYSESNIDGTVGGSHHCLLHLVQHLDRSQFTPTVVFSDAHALVPAFSEVAETIVIPKDTPVQWSAGGPIALARRGVNLTRLASKVRWQLSFLRQRGIRLLHLNNSVTSQHDWMVAAMLAGVPIVVHERGLPTYSRIDRLLARRLALVIPMSRWIERAMRAQGIDVEQVRVLYDGLNPGQHRALVDADEVRAAWNIGPAQPIVGIVGNIRHWKGQETVVRALAQVVRTHPDVVCLFVGAATPEDQDYRGRLDRLISDAGIERNTRFTGFQRDVASLVGAMQIVIHASVSPEPFGMVILEAMALKKPVIGSRAGGVVEMVVEGETGYTFPPGEPEELARRLTELLAEPARAAEMGRRGYERLVRDFSMDRYISGIHAAYRAILDRRPLPPAAVSMEESHVGA